MEYDPRGEMRYLFDYFWRTTKLKFYRSDMHGVNWEAIGEAYRKFLPHINPGKISLTCLARWPGSSTLRTWQVSTRRSQKGEIWPKESVLVALKFVGDSMRPEILFTIR